MPLQWKFFRLLCVLQLLFCIILAGYFATRSLLMGFSFLHFLQAIGYVFIVFLASLGMQLLNNHYPDSPLDDIQRKRFNRLYLINIFVLCFLFAGLFASYYQLQELRQMVKAYQIIPLRFYLMPFVHLLVLLFQFLLLYGLLVLRRTISGFNRNQQFEFEDD